MSSNKHICEVTKEAFVSCTNTASVLKDHNSISLVEDSAREEKSQPFEAIPLSTANAIYHNNYGLASLKALLI